MIYLNDDAIRYAISICREKPYYIVGIVAANAERRQLVFKILLESLREHDYRIHRSRDNVQVYFNNGSKIRTIKASDNARGYKSHLLLIDSDINHEIIDCVLRPLEIPELYELKMCGVDFEEFRVRETDLIKDEFVCMFQDDGVDIVDEEEFFNILESGI